MEFELSDNPYVFSGCSWYAIYVWDRKVLNSLAHAIPHSKVADRVRQVIEPKAKKVTHKRGRWVEKEIRVLEGYCFIECVLDDQVWEYFDSFPGVVWVPHVDLSLLPTSNQDVPVVKPPPLTVIDVHNTLMLAQAELPVKYVEVGDIVTVTTGPLEGMEGRVVSKTMRVAKIELTLFSRTVVVDTPLMFLEKVE